MPANHEVLWAVSANHEVLLAIPAHHEVLWAVPTHHEVLWVEPANHKVLWAVPANHEVLWAVMITSLLHTGELVNLTASRLNIKIKGTVTRKNYDFNFFTFSDLA